ncbi:MAG: dTDP-4-amino-4,6-dideoxygalactose transaminase [Gammaproteobacteria bacterium]|nr:dTDP-4-amino-4,6-dideoxygalactose transaminase [Gammaproteobacteria bacterium]MBI5616605.1 dTDP-4-amino-4,6-dideoxygalactose transaminase [Gammaproteobacteria bacterium]
MHIPFNRPHLTGREHAYIDEAKGFGVLAGDGEFTRRCSRWLEETTGTRRALLTHSCTAALEMTAILIDIRPGDEVIMPSFTFVSTANAFVLRGGVPVFVDIRPDTLNIDETLIEEAITDRTRAIVPVHYAGVGCEMPTIMDIAARRGLIVIEDAAQAICARYASRALGSIGHFGALSFHETKNIISGEGGALLLNDPAHVARAEIIREKGTNRSQFFRGEVDKYTWMDLGSSYLPGDLTAAFLYAQMEQAEEITRTRLRIWATYDAALAPLEREGLLRRPIVPAHCTHNAHMYYIMLPDAEARPRVIAALRARGIHAIFHYVPLHSSPAGRRFARTGSSMSVTEDSSGRLLRLPMWIGLPDEVPALVAKIIAEAISGGR